MGRTYIFSCEKCEYQAKVAGGLTEGVELIVQTIVCHECRQLKDAVRGLKVPHFSPLRLAPPIDEVIKQLKLDGREPVRWEFFELACRVSADHEVKEWKHPGKCPRCGSFMEPSTIPFQQWD